MLSVDCIYLQHIAHNVHVGYYNIFLILRFIK